MKQHLLPRILALCLMMIPLIAASQTSNKLNVRGTVYEKSTLKPLQGATVQLFHGDSLHFVTGNITLANGQYLLTNVTPGNYTVRISFVGFETQKFTLNLPERSGNFKAGDVLLKESSIMLAEAVITGKAPEMQVVEDTVVYNASAFTVPEGSVLEELIKKL